MYEFYSLIPAKHMNPMDISPDKSMVIPKPLKGAGILEYHNFRRMAAMAMIASAQPMPPPKPNTTDSKKL